MGGGRGRGCWGRRSGLVGRGEDVLFCLSIVCKALKALYR